MRGTINVSRNTDWFCGTQKIMPLHADFEKAKSTMTKKHGAKMLSSQKTIKTSATEGIELKEEKEETFVEGFIATTHPDRVKDIIPKSTIKKIVDKINSQDIRSDANSVSWHHDRNDPCLVARAVHAELKPMNDGNWGAFTTVQLNKEHPDFEKQKYEIQNKFVNGFSIEYETNKSHPLMVNGEEFRSLDDIELRGFGFASPRIIANPEAVIVSVEDKELDYKEIMPIGGTTMTEQIVEQKEVTTQPVAEVKEMPKSRVEVDKKEYEEFMKYQMFQNENKRQLEIKELVKKELASIMPELKPTLPVENKEMIECKEMKEWKEMLDSNKNLGVKEAFNRAKALATKQGLFDKGTFSTKTFSNPFESERMSFKSGGLNGEKIEVKALETDTNKSTDTDYLQSAAELSDVYAPAIQNLLNQSTTLWAKLPKDNFSTYQAIQWRAENVANTSAGAYFEGAAITKGNTTREKLTEHFKYYSVGVQVTGQMIASARGGVGDIFNIEVEAATRALLSVMNTALFAEKGAFTDEEFLGMEYIADSAGNTTLYGLTRSTTNLLGASGSEYAAQSSAAITRDTLRAAIENQVVNGCDKNAMFFVCHPRQVRMIIRECLDSWQQLDKSARAGFEGSLVFDGVPIFEDKDCNTDDIYLVDPTYLRIGVQVPVTYEKLAQSDDSQSGFLKFYGNLYATAPKKAVYMIQGLATS